MSIRYEAWQDENRCWECGHRPSKRDYIAWLEERDAELERISKFTPEEFAAWYERRRIPDIVSQGILDELRPTSVVKPFLFHHTTTQHPAPKS